MNKVEFGWCTGRESLSGGGCRGAEKMKARLKLSFISRGTGQRCNVLEIPAVLMGGRNSDMLERMSERKGEKSQWRFTRHGIEFGKQMWKIIN